MASAIAGDDGRYRIDGVPPGRYLVESGCRTSRCAARRDHRAGLVRTVDATLRLSLSADVAVTASARSATSPTSIAPMAA